MGRSIPQNRTVQSLVSGLALLFFTAYGIACSESTNVMGLIAASSAEQDAAALLSRSRIRFDEGDYEGALKDAEQSVAHAPDCGACAVQAAYCHLGVAGLDIFQLARKMLEQNAEKDTQPAEDRNASGQLAECSNSCAQLAEDSNASGQLAALGSLVGLGADDYAAITLEGNKLGPLEGAPATGPFRTLPVYLPKAAPAARASDSFTIQHIARAIEIICPFMPDAVKVLGDHPDIRHDDPSCLVERDQGRAHTNALFVWAIAHLVEAIAFHQVVLFSADGAEPNLQKRAAILENRTEINSLTEYVKAVTDLAAIVDIILPTGIEAARASMLTAMLNDLQTVSLAFQNMAAVPADLSQGIVKAIDELQGQKDKISEASQGTDQDQGSVVFKDQLTEGLATELQKQISARIDAGELSVQERTDLCSAYRQISTQAFASCDTP